MKTTKPIATISYNSEAYLALKLGELLASGKISFWAFVPHIAEDDEATKDHCHVYVEPSKLLQTDDLREYLKEFDPLTPSKPLGCIQWVSSKFDDWYLYGLHDKAYLASKGQSRRYRYRPSDFRTSDDDDLHFKVKRINRLSVSPYSAMLEAQRQGLTWQQFVRLGSVPIPQFALFEKAWFALLSDETYRNDRDGHEVEVDADTGEVLEQPSDSSENAPQSSATPSWYEVHTDANFVSLDPEEELPW